MSMSREGSADRPRTRACAAALALAVVAACAPGDSPPRETFYERRIEPILMASCSGGTAGCHAANPDDPFAFAAGNLDVTSFESLQKRRDLLENYGPYPVPLLLIKAVGRTDELGITYQGAYRPLEIPHGGGSILEVGSDAYLELLRWLENGATETGQPPASQVAVGRGPCSTAMPDSFDEGAIVADPTFAQFRDQVQPVLATCSAGNCHGAPQADFYLTCGEGDRQLAFNFSQARAFVAAPVADSQILRVPLTTADGGYGHTGGDHFASRNADDYVAVAAWAEQVGPAEFGAEDPGKAFFADHVQPLLTARGCSFSACHSPETANDFKLRAGSRGFFSPNVLERNYEILRDEFMAMEVADARRGRAVAKGLIRRSGGIAHRGGPVLETPGEGGADPGSCPAEFDPDTASAFCVMQRWVDIERDQLLAAGEATPMGEGDVLSIVYVERDPGHVASPLEFDTYQAGSDLLVADATLAADGSFASIGAPRSLLADCAGAEDRGAVDVSRPDVHRDGRTVVFAMRRAAAEPRQLYTVDLDGTGCTQLTDDEGETDGILIHNFDPVWSPDGDWIVFASTRGRGGGSPAPSLSRRWLLPQSSLFRIRADGSGLEQMTFLSNSEISPSFKRNGRLIMTTEKVSQGLYQLAGRRLNWDRTDYHPLLAQRAESPFGDPDDPYRMFPSVGYAQATEIRTAFDGNFLLVLSDVGARGGAGTLASFNRSVGTFELGRDDPGFLRAMVLLDPAATGRVGESTSGAYRSPFPLPDGRVMTSYADFSGDLGQATSLNFNLVALDPRTGDREVLIASGGAIVEAVLALARPEGHLFINRRQLLFGGGVDLDITGGEDAAVMHLPDVPLLFTLVNANLRRGRPVALFDEARYLAVYREERAPPTTSGPNAGEIFEERELLGRAELAADGSIMVRAPAGVGLILELQDQGGNVLETMLEEHQLGPGEFITFGVPRELFDQVCGSCHGSVSGSELDVGTSPDVLTGASESLAREAGPVNPQ
jgi:hypothetical protein